MNSFLERSHPDSRQEQEEAHDSLEMQLRDIAHQIDSHRRSLRPVPSENAWAKEWTRLGSQKTWSKILRGDFSEISVEAKLPDYRAVLAGVTAQTKARAAEVLYDDLGGAQDLMLAALRLMHHYGKDRLILVEGGSGSGKSSALAVLKSSGSCGSAIYLMDANETWKSQRVAMRAILKALGETDAKIPAVTGEMMELLKFRISEKGRVILAIDEAHHVSGTVLNLFKTLLNETEMLLIIAGMATLLQKLRASASEEAKQLMHNRLFCRVTLAGPNAEGASDFLSRRLSVIPSWRKATLEQLAATAAHAGLWSFLRRLVDQLATSGITDPTDADLLSAGQNAKLEIA